MNGILVADKPSGFTSFDVVAITRGASRERKIGHSGTLDPMATGVLPLLLGKATKIEQFLPEHDKTYIAGFQLGIATDTQDTTGQVLATRSVKCDSVQLENVLCSFRGQISQLPPMYSAVQVNGRRLYDLAREGITIDRKPRIISIYELKLLEYNPETGNGSMKISCSKGTYIRTICADVGEQLGCGGVMTSLRRTKACGFTLEQATTPDEIKYYAATGELNQRLIPMESALSHLPKVNVTAGQGVRFCNGGGLEILRLSHFCGELPDSTTMCVFDPKGVFLGIGQISHAQNILKVIRILI